MNTNISQLTPGKTQLQQFADRLETNMDELNSIIMNTVMPTGPKAPTITPEIVSAFLMICNQYKLNPVAKEIYAFPAKGGGIQPVVSIDGWLKIINSDPQFNGMDIEFSKSTILKNKREVPEYCTVKIHRKDREFPTVITEYMDDCYRNLETWQTKPRRMLQHKAVMQAARYAFGLSGLVDRDEAQDEPDHKVIKDITPGQDAPGKIEYESRSEELAEMLNEDISYTGEVPAYESWCLSIETAADLAQLEEIGNNIGTDPDLDDAEKKELRQLYSKNLAKFK